MCLGKTLQRTICWLEKFVNHPTEGNARHADRTILAYQGGGECRSENMRTLWVARHFDVTAAQSAERRRRRAGARKLLKVIRGTRRVVRWTLVLR
ncbi:hypothetical protein L6164_014528 [Bauhinia variegata]|uniref:Uncharacterized protein n=1 Tax=Bauhinia variegata TaxID=167791 RepID=A0ACB9NHT3_BAUVA|nr:hypothetical protein L6164_014528 [Bauhinia variegata]